MENRSAGQGSPAGAVAQLGERLVCIQEVESSILFGSTYKALRSNKLRKAFFVAICNRRVCVSGMKKISWETKVALWLALASLVLYLIDFACLRDWYSLWASALTNLAFLPLSVIVITLIIDRMLSVRDRAVRLDRLNMLISAFFSQLGNNLLSSLAARDGKCEYLRDHFGAGEAWNGMNVREAKRILSGHRYELSVQPNDFRQLQEFFSQKADCLLRLLESPNLLEHERFTELLRVIAHLNDELSLRADIYSLPASDLKHLNADVNRCYGPLVREWVHHMWHLKQHYPYLFSLAVRNNPFDPNASPVVK